ncbi:hypothetical protein GQ55_3G144600 [Panicum hallii var. hallii]|uniref:Uncharacterized protein n=1 Tax=Panicum hallii var. hallii TaxID=1504633 RepID=A0A2T7E9F9_9POAL|nr:hypothetical protein GQ55_3G144600 [Panicum hallii var. hallii]
MKEGQMMDPVPAVYQSTRNKNQKEKEKKQEEAAEPANSTERRGIMHAQRSLGCRPCRLGPTEGLAHPHSGPHQWRAATLRSSRSNGGNGFRPGLGGSAAEFVLPPAPTPPPPISFLLCLRRADAPPRRRGSGAVEGGAAARLPAAAA